MKKLVTAALLAAIALPAVANAQSDRDMRHDRQEVRKDEHKAQAARQDLRQDVRDRDRAWRNDDWRDWRGHNRDLYRGGNWRAPFRYQPFREGMRISFDLFAPQYRIADPWRYHLARPGYNQVWVRHYNDLLLVDMRRGVVIRVIRGFYW